MSKNTLEEFVKSYFKKKKKSADADTYEVWAAKNLPTDTGAHASIVRAKTEHMTSSPKYGNLAEKLARVGLNSGGYSKFIKEKTDEKKRAEIRGAHEEMARDGAAAVTSYEKYLKEKDAAYEKLIKDTVSEIGSYGILNLESAMEIAKERGISEADIESVAKTATDTVRRRIRKSVSERIVSQQLTEKQTYEYARSLGLSEDDARDLANYARDINDYISN